MELKNTSKETDKISKLGEQDSYIEIYDIDHFDVMYAEYLKNLDNIENTNNFGEPEKPSILIDTTLKPNSDAKNKQTDKEEEKIADTGDFIEIGLDLEHQSATDNQNNPKSQPNIIDHSNPSPNLKEKTSRSENLSEKAQQNILKLPSQSEEEKNSRNSDINDRLLGHTQSVSPFLNNVTNENYDTTDHNINANLNHSDNQDNNSQESTKDKIANPTALEKLKVCCCWVSAIIMIIIVPAAFFIVIYQLKHYLGSSRILQNNSDPVFYELDFLPTNSAPFEKENMNNADPRNQQQSKLPDITPITPNFPDFLSNRDKKLDAGQYRKADIPNSTMSVTNNYLLEEFPRDIVNSTRLIPK